MAKITVLGRTRLGGKQQYGDLTWDGDKIRLGVLVAMLHASRFLWSSSESDKHQGLNEGTEKRWKGDTANQQRLTAKRA